MRLRDKRFGIAILLLAFAACDEDSTTQPEDEAPGFDDDSNTDGDEGAEADAGLSPRRDASSPGASDASFDAGAPDDDDDEMETMQDGGRRRRDGGTPARDASSTPPTDAAVPATGDCASTAASWDPKWVAFEEEVLKLTNEARIKGATCGTTPFPAVKELAMEARLQCAARLYSQEMIATNNFSHTSKDGTTFGARINRTGYVGNALGENIAKGQTSPAQVVAGWLKSEGHCKNIMSGSFTQIGVGYAIQSGAQAHWTQDFGKPR